MKKNKLSHMAVIALIVGFAALTLGCMGLFPAVIATGGAPAGTYTFYPRLRAIQGGSDVDAYLDRIEVRGRNVTLYLNDRAVAKGRGPRGSWTSIASSDNNYIITNLDRPSQFWIRTNLAGDDISGGIAISFEGVTATRFSLTNNYESPGIIFEEIILDTPDPVVNIPPLRNGTYTFYPRLKAIQAGTDVNAYIDRVIVRAGYFNVVLTNESEGMGRGPAGSWTSIASSDIDYYIQDLDNPARTWVRANLTGDEDTGGIVLSFEGVTATRFSLTNRYEVPNYIFDEIILGEPDY